MVRETSFVLVVAATLIAVITAFDSSWPKPASGSVANTERTLPMRPRYFNTNRLDQCFLEPFECGLVVW
jgi:hypothetical protein